MHLLNRFIGNKKGLISSIACLFFVVVPLFFSSTQFAYADDPPQPTSNDLYAYYNGANQGKGSLYTSISDVPSGSSLELHWTMKDSLCRIRSDGNSLPNFSAPLTAGGTYNTPLLYQTETFYLYCQTGASTELQIFDSVIININNNAVSGDLWLQKAGAIYGKSKNLPANIPGTDKIGYTLSWNTVGADKCDILKDGANIAQPSKPANGNQLINFENEVSLELKCQKIDGTIVTGAGDIMPVRFSGPTVGGAVADIWLSRQKDQRSWGIGKDNNATVQLLRRFPLLPLPLDTSGYALNWSSTGAATCSVLYLRQQFPNTVPNGHSNQFDIVAGLATLTCYNNGVKVAEDKMNIYVGTTPPPAVEPASLSVYYMGHQYMSESSGKPAVETSVDIDQGTDPSTVSFSWFCAGSSTSSGATTYLYKQRTANERDGATTKTWPSRGGVGGANPYAGQTGGLSVGGVFTVTCNGKDASGNSIQLRKQIVLKAKPKVNFYVADTSTNPFTPMPGVAIYCTPRQNGDNGYVQIGQTGNNGTLVGYLSTGDYICKAVPGSQYVEKLDSISIYPNATAPPFNFFLQKKPGPPQPAIDLKIRYRGVLYDSAPGWLTGKPVEAIASFYGPGLNNCTLSDSLNLSTTPTLNIGQDTPPNSVWRRMDPISINPSLLARTLTLSCTSLAGDKTDTIQFVASFGTPDISLTGSVDNGTNFSSPVEVNQISALSIKWDAPNIMGTGPTYSKLCNILKNGDVINAITDKIPPVTTGIINVNQFPSNNDKYTLSCTYTQMPGGLQQIITTDLLIHVRSGLTGAAIYINNQKTALLEPAQGTNYVSYDLKWISSGMKNCKLIYWDLLYPSNNKSPEVVANSGLRSGRSQTFFSYSLSCTKNDDSGTVTDTAIANLNIADPAVELLGRTDGSTAEYQKNVVTVDENKKVAFQIKLSGFLNFCKIYQEGNQTPIWDFSVLEGFGNKTDVTKNSKVEMKDPAKFTLKCTTPLRKDGKPIVTTFDSSLQVSVNLANTPQISVQGNIGSEADSFVSGTATATTGTPVIPKIKWFALKEKDGFTRNNDACSIVAAGKTYQIAAETGDGIIPIYDLKSGANSIVFSCKYTRTDGKSQVQTSSLSYVLDASNSYFTIDGKDSTSVSPSAEVKLGWMIYEATSCNSIAQHDDKNPDKTVEQTDSRGGGASVAVNITTDFTLTCKGADGRQIFSKRVTANVVRDVAFRAAYLSDPNKDLVGISVSVVKNGSSSQVLANGTTAVSSEGTQYRAASLSPGDYTVTWRDGNEETLTPLTINDAGSLQIVKVHLNKAGETASTVKVNIFTSEDKTTHYNIAAKVGLYAANADGTIGAKLKSVDMAAGQKDMGIDVSDCVQGKCSNGAVIKNFIIAPYETAGTVENRLAQSGVISFVNAANGTKSADLIIPADSVDKAKIKFSIIGISYGADNKPTPQYIDGKDVTIELRDYKASSQPYLTQTADKTFYVNLKDDNNYGLNLDNFWSAGATFSSPGVYDTTVKKFKIDGSSGVQTVAITLTASDTCITDTSASPGTVFKFCGSHAIDVYQNQSSVAQNAMIKVVGTIEINSSKDKKPVVAKIVFKDDPNRTLFKTEGSFYKKVEGVVCETADDLKGEEIDFDSFNLTDAYINDANSLTYDINHAYGHRRDYLLTSCRTLVSQTASFQYYLKKLKANAALFAGFKTALMSKTYGAKSNTDITTDYEMFAEIYAILSGYPGQIDGKVSALTVPNVGANTLKEYKKTILNLIGVVRASALETPTVGFTRPIKNSTLFKINDDTPISMAVNGAANKTIQSTKFSIKTPKDDGTYNPPVVLETVLGSSYTVPGRGYNASAFPYTLYATIKYTDGTAETIPNISFFIDNAVRPGANSEDSNKNIALLGSANPLNLFVPRRAMAAGAPITTLSSMPVLKQGQFNHLPYASTANPTGTIASSGSGIVSLGMVLNYYANTGSELLGAYADAGTNLSNPFASQTTNYQEARPVDLSLVADYAKRHNYISSEGTAHGLFTAYAGAIGFDNTTIYDGALNGIDASAWQLVKDFISAGRPVIVGGATVNPFVGSEHYIVLTGVDDNGNVTVNNPHTVGDPTVNNGLWDGRAYSEAMIKRYMKYAFAIFPKYGLTKLDRY